MATLKANIIDDSRFLSREKFLPIIFSYHLNTELQLRLVSIRTVAVVRHAKKNINQVLIVLTVFLFLRIMNRPIHRRAHIM